jgi:hypothetical protein
MVRPFQPEDIKQINSWYGARGIPPIDKHLFPDVGYIEPGVAAGFLYQTDSSLCFIDGYVANPAAPKASRGEAFDAITISIVRTAKDHGFRQILAYTEHPEIKKRCERSLFNLKGRYDLYVRDI